MHRHSYSSSELTEDMQLLLEHEVLVINFTYLYLSMRPTEILPSLELAGLFTRSQMEEVQSRKSDTAKNAVILSILRKEFCPLEPFCSVLSKLPKQQSIADQLMRGRKHYIIQILPVTTCTCIWVACARCPPITSNLLIFVSWVDSRL